MPPEVLKSSISSGLDTPILTSISSLLYSLSLLKFFSNQTQAPHVQQPPSRLFHQMPGFGRQTRRQGAYTGLAKVFVATPTTCQPYLWLARLETLQAAACQGRKSESMHQRKQSQARPRQR